MANCGFSFRFPVKIGDDITKVFRFRAFARSGNPGVPVLFGEHNLPSLVEIGLTDLPKSGDAMATPAPACDDTPAADLLVFRELFVSCNDQS